MLFSLRCGSEHVKTPAFFCVQQEVCCGGVRSQIQRNTHNNKEWQQFYIAKSVSSC